MVARSARETSEAGYVGLRLSAEQFLALPETLTRYELVDGVVIAPPDEVSRQLASAEHLGRRMTSGEFVALPESPIRYELVDGVVIVSPSPSYWHQKIAFEISRQVDDFLRANPIGEVVPDIDVTLREDLVYRPDVVFLSAATAARIKDRIAEAPDLVVEVVSPDSREYDLKTKRNDYEAAGVAEYWVIDPHAGRMYFYALEAGRYREQAASDNHYASKVLAGFVLDLARLRKLF